MIPLGFIILQTQKSIIDSKPLTNKVSLIRQEYDEDFGT